MKLLKEENWEKIIYDISPDFKIYKERLTQLKDTDNRAYSDLLLVDSDLEHAYNRKDLLDKINQLNAIKYPIGTIYKRASKGTYIDVTDAYRKYFN